MEGQHRTEVVFALPTRPSQVHFLPFPNKKINMAEIYGQQHCLEKVDRAKSLIIDRTHLVLDSGRLALQKEHCSENLR